MENKNHKRAKILTLIPVIVFVVNTISLVPLTISYFSTGSDVTAVALILIGTLSLVFTTLPCLIMSIVGTVYASKAKKEGQRASVRFFVLGVIEIVVYSVGVICMAVAVLLLIIAAGR